MCFSAELLYNKQVGKKAINSNRFKDWQDRSKINLDVVCFDYTEGKDFTHFNEVYVWDLDKTYLDTKIDSLKGLLGTIFEKTLTKKNVPGAAELIKSISRFRKKHYDDPFFPLFFVSASPPQMESKIIEKFQLDSISPLMMYYKDNLKNLSPSRFLFLKKQVGYKIQSLLQLRLQLNNDVKFICFGDDSESDAIIYSLFSDICARRLTETQLTKLLTKFFVSYAQIDEILRLQQQIVIQDPVDKIYINLATDTDPQFYLKYGRRCLATYDSFQIALDLVQDQRLSLEELNQIMIELVSRYDFTNHMFIKSFEDLVQRRILGLSSYEMITNYFLEKNIISQGWKMNISPLREKRVENGKVYELEGLFEPWIKTNIDYINDF